MTIFMNRHEPLPNSQAKLLNIFRNDIFKANSLQEYKRHFCILKTHFVRRPGLEVINEY